MSKAHLTEVISKTLVNTQDNFTWDPYFTVENGQLYVTEYDDATHQAVAKYEVHINLLQTGLK